MPERKFEGQDGRTWTVRARRVARRDESATHVTLEFSTHNEGRVVSCRFGEWEVAEPDFQGLLARSVASGASRSMEARKADNSGE